MATAHLGGIAYETCNVRRENGGSRLWLRMLLDSRTLYQLPCGHTLGSLGTGCKKCIDFCCLLSLLINLVGCEANGLPANISFITRNLELVHCEDGPAIVCGSIGVWVENGMLHRRDGPAIHHAGRMRRWFLQGDEYSKPDFAREVAREPMRNAICAAQRSGLYLPQELWLNVAAMLGIAIVGP